MACTSPWVPLNITNNSAGDDGCILFTHTLTNSGQTLASGAVLQYKETDTAAPKTVFTTTSDVPITGTQFNIPASAMSFGNFHIPSKGLFTGGDYNSVTNVVYCPGAAGGSMAGTFQHVTPQADDPDCDWTATSTGFPSEKEKGKEQAAY